MALTPEDVVNKRFNPTKFREGYDQDEVDDFLDEVVVELRRLNQENEELRQRLVAGESRIAELQRGAAAASPAAIAPAPAPIAAPEPAFAPPAAPVADTSAIDPNNTNNLLQLARRLHEEHVREGMEKRDALIAEGHATAARVVSEAQQAQAAQLAEAQAAQQAVLATLEQQRSALEQATSGLESEKASLESKIDALRAFEKEYREKLRSYIQGQLSELDSTKELSSGGPRDVNGFSGPSGVPTPAPAYGTVPQAAAPAGYPAVQSSEFGAYSQPSDYPGFAPGS